MKGGMTDQEVSEFYFGEVVDITGKILRAVTLADVAKNTADGKMSSQSVGRLHELLSSLIDVEVAPVREAMPLAIAVVSPWDADISTLGDALDNIATDQPEPTLAPFTGRDIINED